MKYYAINILYNSIDITSNFTPLVDTGDYDKVVNLIEKAAEGGLEFLKFVSPRGRHYFPKNILINSVISIITDERED